MNRKIILYGAGKKGVELAKWFSFTRVKIECFCDKDPNKRGTLCCGILVKSIGDVKYDYASGEYMIIVAISGMFRQDALNELMRNDIFSPDDFYDEQYDIFNIMPFIAPSPKYPHRADIVDKNIKETSSRLIKLDKVSEGELKNALTKYFDGCGKDYNVSATGRKDFSDHLFGRLEYNRERIIPWLNSVYPLRGTRILEIGSGSGASTVAICEQGANVIGIDVSPSALDVARARMDIYGTSGRLMNLNATDIGSEFQGERFDFVIYSASLEHMTVHERLVSIRSAYQLIGRKGVIVLLETPNRLWCVDSHTSFEPFFHWLPDSIAKEYAKFTSRERFNLGFAPNDEGTFQFARWGRGVSYHEFEMACDKKACFDVLSSMRDFWEWPKEFFSDILRIYAPEYVPDAFLERELYLALR